MLAIWNKILNDGWTTVTRDKCLHNLNIQLGLQKQVLRFSQNYTPNASTSYTS